MAAEGGRDGRAVEEAALEILDMVREGPEELRLRGRMKTAVGKRVDLVGAIMS